MSVPSKRVVREELRRLRALVESDTATEAEKRIAYAVECAIRWATENTTGWAKPSQEVADHARAVLDRKEQAR